MKKKSFILTVLAIFIISSLFVFTILFFINPLTQVQYNSPIPDVNRKNISEVIQVTELQEIFTETKTSKPTSDEILNFTKFYNDDKSIYWDDIYVDETSITENSATLVTDNSVHYYGSIEVVFTVNNIVNLESIFSGKEFNLGNIFLSPEENITKQQILAKLEFVAPECDQKHIKLLNLNNINNTVLLVGDGLKYQGHILLSFTIHRTTIELDTKLVDRELGIIKTHWEETPIEDQIKVAIKAKTDNQDVNLHYIQIDKIEKTSAEISGIGHYQGTVVVNYQIDMRIDLKEHLIQRELGTLEILQSDADENRFLRVLLIHILMSNENVLISAITVKENNVNLSSTSATIIPSSDKIDEMNYIGTAEVTFKFQIVTK